MKDDFVSIEHLVLGYFQIQKYHIAQVLKDFKALPKKQLELSALNELRKGERVTSQNARRNLQFVAQIR